MNSTELGKIISFVKKASRTIFAFQALRGFIISVGISEVLASVLVLLSNFTNYFGRSTALSISGGTGLTIFFLWSFILLLKKPDTAHIVKIIDRRCGLQERLVTAWEFQERNFLFVPFLIDDLVPRLANISHTTYVQFHFKRKFVVFFCVISLLLAIIINMEVQKEKVHSDKDVSHVSEQMGMMADALKELDKQEGARAKELSAVKKAAKELKKTEELLSSGKISKEEAAEEIGKIKDALVKESPALKASEDDGQSSKDSHKIDLGDGMLDKLFYGLMDKLDKINVFDRKGVLKDILKVLDSFEIKLGGKRNRKIAKKGKKIEISKRKTPYTKTMYINMDVQKAKELGPVKTDKSKTNKQYGNLVSNKSSNKELLDFYKNYINSIGNSGELSFVDKKLVIDYFDKLNKK